ncbi:hypothetical protein Tco_1312036 [Tanacetum coccineum]
MDLENTLIKYLNDIEKGIEARAHHEEALQIKEKDVKERREKERRVIEFELLKLETMTQKGECNNPGDANKEKQSKEKCLIHFRLLFTLFEDFSKEDLINTCFLRGFQRASLSLFGEDVEYFAPRLFFNMDKLESHGCIQVKWILLRRPLQIEDCIKGMVNLIVKKSSGITSEKKTNNSLSKSDTNAEDGMMSKDVLEIDNNVVRASHDKNNITEAQSSNT